MTQTHSRKALTYGVHDDDLTQIGPALIPGKVQSPAIALSKIDLSLGRGAARVHVLRGISLEVARARL